VRAHLVLIATTLAGHDESREQENDGQFLDYRERQQTFLEGIYLYDFISQSVGKVPIDAKSGHRLPYDLQSALTTTH
jgi:hypothetical protein